MVFWEWNTATLWSRVFKGITEIYFTGRKSEWWKDPLSHLLPQEKMVTVSSNGKSTLLLLIVPSLCCLNLYSCSSTLVFIASSPYISATVLSHSPTVKCCLNQSIGFKNCCEFRLNSVLSPICITPITKGKMKTLVLSAVQTFPTTKVSSSGVELL